MFKIFTRFSTYTLAVALIISAISAYYSIVGLTAIFAAAVVPIIIMGGALEAGKLVAAVWLKLNWQRSPISYKMYLVPAVAFLMVLTSMGIFGFLSKAHSDQGLVTGDAQAKIAIYDEKIKIQRDNIAANKTALSQMDTQVNDIMSKGDSERSVERSVQIRRQQAKERGILQKEIEVAQKNIQALTEERAPLAAENRKIEAEVGPIKYIAALIYGDNPDANLLEAAVRWVIILIVAVFDPLALVLILAAQQSMRWEREDELKAEEEREKDVEKFFDRVKKNAHQLDEEAKTELVEQELEEVLPEVVKVEEPTEKEVDYGKHEYLFKPFVHFTGLTPMVPSKAADEVTWPEVKVEKPVDEVVEEPAIEPAPMPEPTADSIEPIERPGDYIVPPSVDEQAIETANVTSAIHMFDPHNEYVSYEGKSTSMAALKSMRPDLILPMDGRIPNKFHYGEKFPREALIGDLYMRVDVKPHRLFKFNGMEWMHVDKNQNTSYLSDGPYVKFLVDKLVTNEYLPEMLTQDEEEEIKNYLQK